MGCSTGMSCSSAKLSASTEEAKCCLVRVRAVHSLISTSAVAAGCVAAAAVGVAHEVSSGWLCRALLGDTGSR